MLELVLGGARSGKSAYAEQCAQAFIKQVSTAKVLYIATATAEDSEMADRIEHHRATRPHDWQTIEEPIKLASILKQHNASSEYIIVDCLTLWLTNLLMRDKELMHQEVDSLLASLSELTSSVIFVSNEVGMGIVPMGVETRHFVDEAGRLHQALAARCQRVTQMIAGIPNRIKDQPGGLES